MSENKRLNNYDELPLVLDVVDIQRIMGSGRLIKVSKIAFFEWMAKGNGRVPENSN